MRRRILLWIAALFATASLSATATAQDALSEGTALLARADFEGAVSAFDRAEAQDDGLTRESLGALYAHRASAHLALGRAGPMRSDLRRLASLDPGHRFSPETRPEIAEAFERLGTASPLGIQASVTEDPGGISISAEATNDPEGLSRSLRLRARVGEGAWATQNGGTLVLPAVTGSTVEYIAEVIGPGGAVLASEGTSSAPARHTSAGAATTGPERDDPLDPDDDDGGNALLIVGIVAAVAAVALIIAIVAVASGGSSDTTTPDPPIIFP